MQQREDPERPPSCQLQFTLCCPFKCEETFFYFDYFYFFFSIVMSVTYQSMLQHGAPIHSFEQSKKGEKIDKQSQEVQRKITEQRCRDLCKFHSVLFAREHKYSAIYVFMLFDVFV